LGGGQKSSKHKRRAEWRRNRFQPRVEEFEVRCVLAPIMVNDLGDAGKGTLRQAIDDVNTAGVAATIEFKPGLVGTITLKSELPALKVNITITGAGWGNIAVERSATAGLFPIFVIAPNKNCEIDGISIGYGSSDIRILQGASLSLDGVAVFGSTSSGIVNNDGSLVMTNCDVYGNSNAKGNGGGIDNSDGSVALLDCQVWGNWAEAAGGIANESLLASLSISDSDISSNTATLRGGGILNLGSLSWNGGSLYANAAGLGGGLFVQQTGPNGVTLTGVSITANEAGPVGTGGGFYLLEGGLTLNTVTLARNKAKTAPGGAYEKGTITTKTPPPGNQDIVQLKPAMGALTPNTGAVTGGTAVALFGQDFDTATGVFFGSTPANFQVISDEEIVAVAPAESAGPVDVTVTNSAGSSDTSPADLYTFSSSLTNTTVSVSSSASTTTYGQAVTLTAAVSSGGSGTPTGSVTFYGSDGTSLGTAGVNGSGVATLVLSGLPAGDDELTAVYGGDQNFAGEAATLSQTVAQASTTTTLTSSAGSAQDGTPLALTATVTSPTSATVPGIVEFWQIDPGTGQDVSFLGTGAVGPSGQVTLTVSTLPPGSDLIQAQYLGGDNFAASSGTLTQAITDNPTVTAVTPATGVSTGGSAVLLSGQDFTGGTAVSFGGTPATSFTFLSDSEILAVAPALPAGPVDVTVTTGAGTSATSPADLFTASTSLGSTATSLSSAGTTTYGQALTLTATVSSGTAGTLTGSVTFLGGNGTILGIASLNSAGVATLTLSSLDAGSEQLTALYTGDPSFAGSAATLQQTVNQAATTTTLTSSANPAVVGTPVTLTATVTSSALVPVPGLVFFWQVDPSSGADLSLLGVGAVDGSGRATLPLTTLPAGSTTVQAAYLADQDFTSSSATLTEVVNQAQPLVMLSSSANPAMEGQPVTFTASVNGPAGVTPTGTVTFYDGTTALGTVSLDAMGTASLTVSNLAVGSHSITAVYSGDATYAGASSSALQEVINGQASMTGLTSSQNPAPAGTPVTFTATVSGMPGTPTGQVQFWVLDPVTLRPLTLLGTGTLNSSGQASLTVSSLSSGSYLIEALYLGDSTFNSSSATLTQHIS
jgi:hypothetical protein